LDVSSVTLLQHNWSKGVAMTWPFAACMLDERSLTLGFGIPWSEHWLKQRRFGFEDIELVMIDEGRILVREDYFTIGQLSAGRRTIDDLERTMIARGVKVERSKIARVVLNRNRGPNT
jgi:hypothetical protein